MVQILPPQLNAQIAQLVEQRTENPRVTGSIPVLGIYIAKYDLIGHAGNININGILAQSVEHLTFNQVVRGSNPRCLIKSFGSTVLWYFRFFIHKFKRRRLEKRKQ